MAFRYQPCGNPRDQISPTQWNLKISDVYPGIHSLCVRLFLSHSRTTVVRRGGKVSDTYFYQGLFCFCPLIHPFVHPPHASNLGAGTVDCGKSAL